MDTRNGQIYSKEELEDLVTSKKMTQEEVDRFVTKLTDEEHKYMQQVKPQVRSSILMRMRGHFPPEK